MKTSLILLFFATLFLNSCVTETSQPEKIPSKRIFGAKLRQGDLKFETNGFEATLTSQLRSLAPGFYQLNLASGNQCPALGSSIEANYFREESDAFYVPDSKPQAVIRHFKKLIPNELAMLIKKNENNLTVIACAPIRNAIVK